MRHPIKLPLFNRDSLLLILLGAASALIYGLAFWRFPLETLYSRLRFNLDDHTKSDPQTGAVIIVCTLLLFAAYALGAVVIHSARRRVVALPALIALMPLIFIGLLTLTQPATSIDVYDYLFRGRMLARYEANTFVQIPRNFESDPLFDQVAWRNAVTAYGPLWERMSWATSRLAGEAPGVPDPDPNATLLRLMLAYKLLSVLGFLLCGAAIWITLSNIAPEQRWLGVYLWLWNPLALWESVAAAHNDAWMMLWIIVAIWAMSWRRGDEVGKAEDKEKGRQGEGETRSASVGGGQLVSPYSAHFAFLSLTIGGLIKYLSLFFGPLMLVAALRRLPTWRERGLLTLLSGSVCLAIVVAAYAQFWAGWDTFRNFTARGDLFYASWIAALQPTLMNVVSEDVSKAIASRLGLGLLLFGTLWSMWRAWRAPYDVTSHMLWLLLWFLFVANPWFQPWYGLWPLAVVALQPWRTRMVVVVALFCLTSMLSYSATAFLLPRIGWTENSATWNALLSAIIYLPPLVALGWTHRSGGMDALRRMRRVPSALSARLGRGIMAR
jgi:alpha-1,6-mannosyltransferase